MEDSLVEEMVLCIVLTNAVEVHADEKHALGTAVYGPSFSWINHSCTPNACYRFSTFGSKSFDSGGGESTMRITGFGDGSLVRNGNGLCGYEPRVVVRSIKPIKKGEVCVTYTDLLQPTGTRHSDLWSRYKFICSCRRCSAVPPTYMDYMLHGSLASNIEPRDSSWDHNFGTYDANHELSDCMGEIISEYLSSGNTECCCDKLENMLIRSLRNVQLQLGEQSWLMAYF